MEKFFMKFLNNNDPNKFDKLNNQQKEEYRLWMINRMEKRISRLEKEEQERNRKRGEIE